MSAADTRARRPLSPHLQIYHWHLTMAMSIAHRTTGILLYAGTVFLAWWLLAAAAGPRHFGFVNGLLGSWPGMVFLFGYTWVLVHHMLGGIRHLIWDTGRGLGKPARDRLALANIIGSVALTILIWIVGLAVR